jgi:hypothetical protein
MIVRTPDAFLEAFAALAPAAPATARAAFLVAPSAFRLAEESARDNRYMDLSERPDPLRALAEHGALAEALRADVPVISFPGDADCPDGVFPNNVFATVPGRLIVGRMRHAVRRREAERRDIRAFFAAMGYAETDLSQREDCVAELTGALVIDRARGVGYCGLSERCDETGARAMHEAFGLKLTFCFDLAAGEYHTNVVMALLAGRAVILAADGFADAAVPQAIAQASGNRALWLDNAQKHDFAGNAITLVEDHAWMSARGAAALTPAQHADLGRWGFALGSIELGEIEKAGGSLRCCVAEIF